MKTLSMYTMFKVTSLILALTAVNHLDEYIGYTPQAHAQDVDSRQFTAKTGAIVSEALIFIENDDHSNAINKLQQALALSNLTSYERSTIYQMMGASYYEMNTYANAINAFEEAIKAGGLLPPEQQDLHVNIAQLLIVNGNFSAGGHKLEAWIEKGGEVTSKHIEMLTQAWVQAENYTKALPWAKRWFEEADIKERKHYDLLNYLYNKLEMPDQQIEIVVGMIEKWPDEREFWDVLISLLVQIGLEEQAFEVTKVLYFDGKLTQEHELLKLIQYYSFYNIPYEAAQIMKAEIKAGQISRTPDTLVQLSDLYRQAREYEMAIPFLEEAASLGDSAKIYANLGEAYYKQEQCDDAEKAFKRAIDLGYDAGKSYMLIATCRYEDSQLEQRPDCSLSVEERFATKRYRKRRAAKLAFEKVPPSSKEYQNAAKWMTFIKAEADAFDRRCHFEITKRLEDCYGQIKRAYSGVVFTREFLLDDPSCKVYLADYNKEYRQSAEYVPENK